MRLAHASTPNASSLISGYAAKLNSYNDNSTNFSRASTLSFLAPSAPSWPTSANWYTYEWNPQRTGDNTNEATLNRSNAGGLELLWKHSFNESVTASLIAVNGTLYVGAWDGNLYALNASTGSQIWTSHLTNPVAASQPCTNRGGVWSTPTFWNGTLYEEAGAANFTAINPATGAVLWTLNTTPYVNTSWPGSHASWQYRLLWSSPLIYKGSAYVGLASACDGSAGATAYKLLPGQLLKIPLSGNHTPTVWFDVTHGANQNDSGGSIWSTPSVDPKTNTVWITTGNENDNATHSYKYARSIIGLNATTLLPVATRQYGSFASDDDFGAGATVYTNSTGATWVAAIHKNGIAYS